jgi:hypothetical protein
MMSVAGENFVGNSQIRCGIKYWLASDPSCSHESNLGISRGHPEAIFPHGIRLPRQTVTSHLTYLSSRMKKDNCVTEAPIGTLSMRTSEDHMLIM